MIFVILKLMIGLLKKLIHQFIKIIGMLYQRAVPRVWHHPQISPVNGLVYFGSMFDRYQVMVATNNQLRTFDGF